MLTTLAIAGYRSLRDVVLPLAPLSVITGPNGSGKSNVYKALRLLSQVASGTLIGAVAREGGLPSLLWAGPERGGTQGTVRKKPVAALLGFASDELGYLVDLGLPQIGQASMFARDPEIKRERVFTGRVATRSSLLVDRTRSTVKVRAESWITLDQPLATHESVVTDLADGDPAPELLSLRRMVAQWRFYDHVRADLDAPARHPQVGTRSPTLAHDGSNVASAWATIEEAGLGAELHMAIGDAFPGSRVSVEPTNNGQLRLVLHQRGLLRPLEMTELSDGTLRYVLLCTALLPARASPLIVLNEPEASLHADLLEPLGALVAVAARRTQVIVVTHATELVESLASAGAERIELASGEAGTTVVGQGLLTRPQWEWGTR